jgi:hypothetical protein
MINDIIACIGLMFIIKYGTILTWYRTFVGRLHPKLAELHKCSLCLGFWCGVVVMSFEVFFENSNHQIYLLPLMSSGACWFSDNLNNTLQSVEIKIDKELDL